MFTDGKLESLSELVRKEIHSTPHVKNALAEGIVNYSALARKLMPEITKQTGRKVNEESLIVAIKRYADELDERTPDKRILEMFAEAEITLQDKMTYVHFRKNDRVLSRLEKLFSNEDWNVGEIRIFIQGAEQAMVITKRHRLEETLAELKDDIVYSINDSALATFRLSGESFSVYGILAEITRELAKKGISVEVVTTPPDLHFLVDEKDAEKTYTVMKHLISDSAEALKKK